MATALENCERFEKLLEKDLFTDEEYAFFVEHPDRCELLIHTDEVLEQLTGLPPGSLKNWNGVGPPPSPIPGQAEKFAKEFIERFLRSFDNDDEGSGT